MKNQQTLEEIEEKIINTLKGNKSLTLANIAYKVGVDRGTIANLVLDRLFLFKVECGFNKTSLVSLQ
jgi:hypothetical protein